MVIPEGVEIIRESAFYDCIKLRSVTLPDSLLTIEFHTFLDCRSLAEITLPPNVREVGQWAFFKGCPGPFGRGGPAGRADAKAIILNYQ